MKALIDMVCGWLRGFALIFFVVGVLVAQHKLALSFGWFRQSAVLGFYGFLPQIIGLVRAWMAQQAAKKLEINQGQ